MRMAGGENVNCAAGERVPDHWGPQSALLLCLCGGRACCPGHRGLAVVMGCWCPCEQSLSFSGVTGVPSNCHPDLFPVSHLSLVCQAPPLEGRCCPSPKSLLSPLASPRDASARWISLTLWRLLRVSSAPSLTRCIMY